MRFNRSSLLSALLVLASTSTLHAAPTGVLTCGSTPTNISYFNLGAVAGPNSAPTETLTIHTALHQFPTLFNLLGTDQGPCTLTHNGLTYTVSSAILTNLNAVSGAQSTGNAGSSTYVQAIFQVTGVSASAGNNSDGGPNSSGDDGGWDRVSNNPSPNLPAAGSSTGTGTSGPTAGGWNAAKNSINPSANLPQ